MTRVTLRINFPTQINLKFDYTNEDEALEAMRTGKLDAMDSISWKKRRK